MRVCVLYWMFLRMSNRGVSDASGAPCVLDSISHVLFKRAGKDFVLYLECSSFLYSN
jgi:hypothetical protein